MPDSASLAGSPAYASSRRGGRTAPRQMKQQLRTQMVSFGVELLAYAAVVVGYYLLVLHFLGGWLHHLFQSERKLYAAVALLLIVAQGILLENLTRFLFQFIKPVRKR